MLYLANILYKKNNHKFYTHTQIYLYICADGPLRELICSLTTYAKARGYKERKEFMKKCIVQMMSPYSGPVTKLSVD
jgi:hypothetical protein